MKECRISTECIGIYFKRYFSRGGEIGHDNKGLLRVPLSAFHAGNAVLEDSKFSDSTLACLGRGLLNISFMD